MKFLLDGEDVKLILNSLGSILVILGFMFSVPMAAAYILGEFGYIGTFLVMTLIFVIAGFFLRIFYSSRQFGFRHALVISAIIWLLVPLVSVVPFVFRGMSLSSAYFETMSGWTTTGLTIIEDVESLPATLLFFRSYMHWLGGIGLILLALTVLRMPKFGRKLYAAETRSENIKLNVFDTAKLIYGVYIALTLLGVALLSAAGMPLFDSVNHSMSAIATGGFSVKNASIGFYDSLPIDVVTIFLMFLGGTNIIVLYHLFHGRLGRLKNVETLLTISIIAVFSVVILSSVSESAVNVLFTVVSALTSTGYMVTDVVNWGDAALFALVILMYIGASSGSTTGAIKIWRFFIIAKDTYREIMRYIKSEHAFLPLRFENRLVEEEDVRKIKAFVLLYIIVAIFFSLALMLAGFPFREAVFTAASAQGNMGLSIVSGGEWFNMPEAAKILLIAAMWIGRLEILPVLVLLRSLLPVRKYK